MSAEPKVPRGALVGVVLALLVAGLIAAAIGLNRAAGPQVGSAVPTPLPSTAVTPPPTPTAAATPAPPPDCSPARFGAPLQPLDPPADLHRYAAAPPMTVDPAKLYLVTMTTTRGVVRLCVEPSLAPRSANVFVTLVRNHFYDGLTIFRSDAGVIQAGSPSNTNAGGPAGGPGFSIPDEPVRGGYAPGCLAFANAGPNTSGSQFFVCKVDDRASFQPKYNLFGATADAASLAVVRQVQVGDVMRTLTVAEQR